MARFLIFLACCVVAALAAPAEDVVTEVPAVTTEESAQNRFLGGKVIGNAFNKGKEIMQTGANAIDTGVHAGVQHSFDAAQFGVHWANEVANMSLAPIRIFRRRNNGVPVAPIPERIEGQKKQPPQPEVDTKLYPYLVVVMYENEYLCGGTIIDNTHVLTAAKCFDATPLRSKKIYIRTIDHQRIHVERVSIHPCYDRTSDELYHDLAVLSLEDEVQFNNRVRSVALPTFNNNAETVKTGYALGWNKYLNSADVFLMDLQACSEYYDISTYQICARSNDGCAGSLGLPLIQRKNGQEVMSGIASYASANCETEPTVYTRVSSYNYWIEKIVQGIKLSDVSCR